MPPNLYLAHEAELKKRAERGRWDYVALRPDLVVGYVYGNSMNIVSIVYIGKSEVSLSAY